MIHDFCKFMTAVSLNMVGKKAFHFRKSFLNALITTTKKVGGKRKGKGAGEDNSGATALKNVIHFKGLYIKQNY